MILELERKLRNQIERNEQPDAFITAWRLIHYSLRKYFANKLCDPEAVARILDSLESNRIPTEADRTSILAPGVKSVNPLESWVLEEYTRRVNIADDKKLFTRYSGLITGVDMSMRIENSAPELWNDYESDATAARHHVVHGKVYGHGNQMGKTYCELTRCLQRIWSAIIFEYYEDEYFKHVYIGGPLPPFSRFTFDVKTRRLTIHNDPKMMIPDYGDGDR